MEAIEREAKLNALFEKLVPAKGKADTVAGEIVRAISRIGYRFQNDGDHIGVGYGRETCNPAARYLLIKCDDHVANLISKAWGVVNDSTYDVMLADIEEGVLAFLDEHPELQDMENTEDMFDYCNEDEDVDDDYWLD